MLVKRHWNTIFVLINLWNAVLRLICFFILILNLSCGSSNDINPYLKSGFGYVDVEGGEYEILKGIDFKKYTPSIIIVEIKADNIHEGINHKISELLLKHGYELHAVCVISYFFVKIKNYLNWLKGCLRIIEYQNESRQ